VLRGKAPPMDIEILCKLVDDSLVPAILAFEEDCVSCIDPSTNLLLEPTFKFFFADMDSLWVRARPEHADIRFDKILPPKQKFRMMSSYLQIITNELLLRTELGQFEVVFEPNIKPFDIYDRRISVAPTLTNEDRHVGFFKQEVQIKTSALLENADDATKKALDEVNHDLEKVSGILGRLGGIAGEMSDELDAQNEQISRLQDKADSAHERIKGSNIKITKIIYNS